MGRPDRPEIDRHNACLSYKVWDQRVCLVPDGDLFRSLEGGSVSVVTDHVQEFCSHGRPHSPPRPRPSCWPTGRHAMPMIMRTCAAGVRLRSGRELPADVIVTATGLNMVDISALVPACV